MSDPVTSHILHAKAERVRVGRGSEVHLTVGVHHDKRFTLAMSPELAAQIAPMIAAAAQPRRMRCVRLDKDAQRLPILKPCGGVL